MRGGALDPPTHDDIKSNTLVHYVGMIMDIRSDQELCLHNCPNITTCTYE